MQAADAALVMAQSTTATLADAQAAKTLADGALATAQVAASNDPTQNLKVNSIGLIVTQVASRVTQLQQTAPPPVITLSGCSATTTPTCTQIISAQVQAAQAQLTLASSAKTVQDARDAKQATQLAYATALAAAGSDLTLKAQADVINTTTIPAIDNKITYYEGLTQRYNAYLSRDHYWKKFVYQDFVVENHRGIIDTFLISHPTNIKLHYLFVSFAPQSLAPALGLVFEYNSDKTTLRPLGKTPGLEPGALNTTPTEGVLYGRLAIHQDELYAATLEGHFNQSSTPLTSPNTQQALTTNIYVQKYDRRTNSWQKIGDKFIINDLIDANIFELVAKNDVFTGQTKKLYLRYKIASSTLANNPLEYAFQNGQHTWNSINPSNWVVPTLPLPITARDGEELPLNPLDFTVGTIKDTHVFEGTSKLNGVLNLTVNSKTNRHDCFKNHKPEIVCFFNEEFFNPAQTNPGQQWARYYSFKVYNTQANYTPPTPPPVQPAYTFYDLGGAPFHTFGANTQGNLEQLALDPQIDVDTNGNVGLAYVFAESWTSFGVTYKNYWYQYWILAANDWRHSIIRANQYDKITGFHFMHNEGSFYLAHTEEWKDPNNTNVTNTQAFIQRFGYVGQPPGWHWYPLYYDTSLYSTSEKITEPYLLRSPNVYAPILQFKKGTQTMTKNFEPDPNNNYTPIQDPCCWLDIPAPTVALTSQTLYTYRIVNGKTYVDFLGNPMGELSSQVTSRQVGVYDWQHNKHYFIYLAPHPTDPNKKELRMTWVNEQ